MAGRVAHFRTPEMERAACGSTVATFTADATAVTCKTCLSRSVTKNGGPWETQEPGFCFFQKIAGVSHKNADGSSRQAIIRQCSVGESLELRREPDNPHDPFAVAVFRSTGQQLGYLPEHCVRDGRSSGTVTSALDSGAECRARISDLTGGTDGKTRGVNILLSCGPITGEEEKLAAIHTLAPKATSVPVAGIIALIAAALVIGFLTMTTGGR